MSTAIPEVTQDPSPPEEWDTPVFDEVVQEQGDPRDS